LSSFVVFPWLLFSYYFIDLPLWESWAHGGLYGGDDDHMLKPQENWLLKILFYFAS